MAYELAGRLTEELCPECGARVVYNGNYFCENLPGGLCGWALPHPARKKADREIALRLTGEYVLMGHQIIKAPDGTYAVFSSFSDTWILWNASRDDLLDYYAEQASKAARENVDRILGEAEENPRRVYAQFTMTFEEANAESIEHGGPDLTKPGEAEEHAG